LLPHSTTPWMLVFWSHHYMDLVRFTRIVHEIRQCRPSFKARIPGGDPVEGGASYPTGRHSGAFKLTSSRSMNWAVFSSFEIGRNLLRIYKMEKRSIHGPDAGQFESSTMPPRGVRCPSFDWISTWDSSFQGWATLTYLLDNPGESHKIHVVMWSKTSGMHPRCGRVWEQIQIGTWGPSLSCSQDSWTILYVFVVVMLWRSFLFCWYFGSSWDESCSPSKMKIKSKKKQT
jgi:hypothetical protein